MATLSFALAAGQARCRTSTAKKRRMTVTCRIGLKVCVIGLGSMGFGMAASLLRGGFVGHRIDLNADAVARLVALGGQVAKNPAEAAAGAMSSYRVVVNAAQTEAVLFGDRGGRCDGPGRGRSCPAPPCPPDAARDFAAQAAGQLGLAISTRRSAAVRCGRRRGN